MHLTTFQRRALEVYRWYRQHPPTLRFYLLAMIWRSSYVLYLGIIGVAVLLLLISRASTIGGWIYLLLGVIIGFIIRALLYYHQTVRLWPMFDIIIDWNKVETLLQTQPPERTEIHDPT
jgi:hypothetical protein